MTINKLDGLAAGCFWMLAGLLYPVSTGGAAALLITGVDTNSPSPHVKAFGADTHAVMQSFFAYGTGFTGGVRVAAGDVNGDGAADIITAAGPGGAPHIKVFSGRDNSELGSFLAYGATFAGGVFVAAGDVDGDGRADLVTGVDEGAGPHVVVFGGADYQQLHSFFAYSPTFQGGVRVATGDVTGDGYADIITGSGPGGGPHVKVFDGRDATERASFFAYDLSFKGGVYVAAGDVNGDAVADVITGAGPGGAAHVKVFDGRDLSELTSFLAYPATFSGGVRVAAGDVNGDGRAEIIVGPGPGSLSTVRIFDLAHQQELESFLAYDTAYQAGIFVAVAPVLPPKLRIEPGRLGAITLSWPAGKFCELQYNHNPADVRAWQAVGETPLEVGDRLEVSLQTGTASVYYRLSCDEETSSPAPM